MTKEQKKALYDSRKKMAMDAGITDKKMIADIASGKVELGKATEKAPAPENGGSSEQGQDLAGKESGETSGSGSEGTAEENKPADNPPEDKKPDAPKEPKGKKIWKMKSNVHHNGKEFPKGQEISPDDKCFKELKEFIE